MAMIRWTVEIAIDESWIVDGFRVTPEAIQEAVLSYCLPYAYEKEIAVKVVKSPTKRQLDAVEQRAIAMES